MKIWLLAGVATLAMTAGHPMAASNPALLTRGQAQRFITGVPPDSKTLHDENKDDAGIAVFSQNLDDTQAADDFVVPKGHTWQIKEVDVTGVYFNGSGPASSENVVFYSDNGGLPGDLLVACPNQNGAGNGFGSFAINLSKSCKVSLSGNANEEAGEKAKNVTYWVSVQANLDFSGGGGEWGWELSFDTNGNPAAWRGETCPTWCALESDLMFALKGKDRR